MAYSGGKIQLIYFEGGLWGGKDQIRTGVSGGGGAVFTSGRVMKGRPEGSLRRQQVRTRGSGHQWHRRPACV